MESLSPVALALSTMSVGQDLLKDLVSKSELWMVFGKMNSHLYRKELMERFQKKSLDAEQRFMVYFLTSVIKSQPRILKALDNMTSEEKKAPWFTKVRSFMDSDLCQYVTQSVSTKKFPIVNLPGTNPGVDILCWIIATPAEYVTVDLLFDRTTTSQLFLNAAAQDRAKAGYKNYWDNVVKGTRNADSKKLDLEKPEMREEFYQNQASDTYRLVSLEMKELVGSEPDTSYSVSDLDNFLFDTLLKLGKISEQTEEAREQAKDGGVPLATDKEETKVAPSSTEPQVAESSAKGKERARE